jgi:hypothetical protein
MKLRKDKQETRAAATYRLTREEVGFLGFALQLRASEQKDRRSKSQFIKTHQQIFGQAMAQVAGQYPSHNPDQNAVNIVLGENERQPVGQALRHVIELDQQGKPGSKLNIQLGDVEASASTREILEQSDKVVDNAGEAARELWERLGFVDPS